MKLKDIIPKGLKPHILKYLQQILLKSLKNSRNEYGWQRLSEELSAIVPDISEQYSTFKLENLYMTTKVRNMHAFQISLVKEIIAEFKDIVIVDIGDSSGTHLRYLLGLYSKEKDIKCLSVNIDNRSVEKIRRKGLEAINARAEDLDKYNITADLFLCFEVLEHLMDPCQFLYRLSNKTKAKYLIVTVPYLKISRVGLHHLRISDKSHVSAERTHVFELSPQDWKLIIRHSGWDIVKEKIYLQYPQKSFLKITRPIWKRFDFEGFYGLILKRDDTWSSRYLDWQD